MSVDLRVVLPNRPGALLDALGAIAEAGITVDGASGDLRPGEKWGYMHVLVADGETARAALEGRGFEVSGAHDVDVLILENRPGALADAVRTYSERGESIEVFYMTTEGAVVVGTEAMRKPMLGVRVEDARYR